MERLLRILSIVTFPQLFIDWYFTRYFRSISVIICFHMGIYILPWIQKYWIIKYFYILLTHIFTSTSISFNKTLVIFSLKSVITFFSSSDLNNIFYIVYKNLTITNVACIQCIFRCFYNSFYWYLTYYNFYFDFR